MRPRSSHRFATSFFLAGLLAVLMSLGGGWGEAYGQTAGPTPTPGGANISISKDVDRTRARPGETVVFTIRVQNTGSAAAQNVVVRDDVPAAFEITGATASAGTVVVSGPTVSVTIPQLNPGETAIITVTTRIRPDARGDLRNTVVATAIDGVSTQQTTQRATATLGVSAEAADEAAADPGDPVGGVSANNGNLRSQLSNTGIDSSLQWWLFVMGILFLVSGGALFLRARNVG